MGWTCMWVPKMTNTCVFLVPRLLNSDPHVTIGLMMWPGLVTSGAESWQFACDPLCIGCAQVWSKSPITLTPKWPKQSLSESSKIQQLSIPNKVFPKNPKDPTIHGIPWVYGWTSSDCRGFNAVIGACKEDGRWAEALSLLFLMEDQQHPPDVVSGLTWLDFRA